MRVYVVVPTEEAYLDSSTKLYVFANKADAEEMVLALVQEELYECFNTCLQDDLETFCCVPERIVPWEDEVYVNCNHCPKKCCPTIQEILGDYEHLLGIQWDIVETELL